MLIADDDLLMEAEASTLELKSVFFFNYSNGSLVIVSMRTTYESIIAVLFNGCQATGVLPSFGASPGF